MEGVVYFCALVSLAATWIVTRKWIRKAPEVGLVGWDMHKLSRPKIPEMGGVCVVFGFAMGVLFYIGIQTFYIGSTEHTQILAAMCVIFMAFIIGMIDDLLGWRAGLKQWQKPILTLFIALPMMVVNAGHSTMNIPIIGQVDFGIVYPLLIVPIGIVGASNAYNMLAGYNGIEAGMGTIILSTLSYAAIQNNDGVALILSLCMICALLAFLYFNWYPAKIFPGDCMTYSLGALVACVAILGDMEKLAVTLFLPYALDLILQSRGKFSKGAFARVKEDGSLDVPEDGIFHSHQVAIAILKHLKARVYERDVVLFMCGVEALIAVVSIYVYL